MVSSGKVKQHGPGKRCAFFAGSFDPPTFGHLDVINKALDVFDEVHVGVASSPSKAAMFPAPRRKEALEREYEHVPAVRIHLVEHLTYQYALATGCTHLIRSLRNGTDFDFELQMAFANQGLSQGKLETWFVAPNIQYLHISSTLVRDLIKHGQDCRDYIPKKVWDCLQP
jgi:pantetheine-phosphate adenylyltransferase